MLVRNSSRSLRAARPALRALLRRPAQAQAARAFNSSSLPSSLSSSGVSLGPQSAAAPAWSGPAFGYPSAQSLGRQAARETGAQQQASEESAPAAELAPEHHLSAAAMPAAYRAVGPFSEIFEALSRLPVAEVQRILASLPAAAREVIAEFSRGFGRFSEASEDKDAEAKKKGQSEPEEDPEQEEPEDKKKKVAASKKKPVAEKEEPKDEEAEAEAANKDAVEEFFKRMGKRESGEEKKKGEDPKGRKNQGRKKEEDEEEEEEEEETDDFLKNLSDPESKQSKKYRPWLLTSLALLTALVGYSVMFGTSTNGSWQGFFNDYLSQGQVRKVVVDQWGRVYVYTHTGLRPAYGFRTGSADAFERKLESAQLQLEIPPSDFVPVEFEHSADWGGMAMTLIPTALLIGFLVWSSSKLRGMGRGGMFGGVGKSKATVIMPNDKTHKKVTYKDVAGMDETKAEIMEFVNFLKDPSKFTRLGAKIPRGALLVGPPGTGKTLLAKATAGEASVPFFSISGSDFIEMFVGVGPSRVRDLFKQARKHAPSIIFIDEIDAVGRARGGKMGGGNEERENTLNQMLVEMDGFNTSEGVVVLAGTNRADILDPALLRPGRFDRQIDVGAPDLKGREEIFQVHLRPLTLAQDPELVAKRMAALTPGFVGADIHNICNEAALLAARETAEAVDLNHFERAIDRVIGGLEKKNMMNPEERRIVAYHESGHAVTGWFLEHTDPLLKVTIVPHSKGALGFAQYLPKEVSLYQREQLLDTMVMALGGRAAEQIFFGKVSSGAQNDLQKVTDMAYRQIVELGMGEIGNLSYPQYRPDQGYFKPFSEETAGKIDQEVQAMVGEAYARALALLERERARVEGLAERLLEVDTVNHEAIVEILGDRPHVTPDYKRYLENMVHRSAGAEKSEAERSDSEDEEADNETGAASKQ